jgi:hypothetical protein
MIRSFVLALAALAPPPGGTVRVVHPTQGPYFDVQSAVDAAADDDTVLIRSGTYAPFTVTDKRLSIVSDSALGVHTGVIRVLDLSPGKTVVLQNLSAAGGTTATPDEMSALVLRNDLGSVRVENCLLEGLDLIACTFTGTHDAGDAVRVETCSDVAVMRSTLQGGDANGDGFQPGNGGFGIRARSSVAALFSCQSWGGNGRACCDGANGGSGGQAELATRLFVAGGMLAGGFGGDANCDCSNGGNGGSGLRVLDTAQLWQFSPQFAGGGGGQGYVIFACSPTDGSGGASLFVAPTAGVTDLASGPVRTLAVDSPARAGTSVTVTVQGRPGESVSLHIGDDAQEMLLPQAHGVLMVESAGPPRRVHLGTIPPSGTLSRQLPIGALPPGQESRVYHLQATHGGTTSQRVLGAPACLVVLDPAF